jgi:hypothetical protein
VIRPHIELNIDFKAATINIFKELKKTMLDVVKESARRDDACL